MPTGEQFAPNKAPKNRPPKRPPVAPPRTGEDVRLGAPAAPPPSPRSGEDVRLGSPTTTPSFTGKPIPLLQQYGYSGSVNDLNARVRGITDAFQNRFGTLPSWGHVFNVLTSKVDDFQSLYDQVPRSTAAANAQGALSQHKQSHPYEYFVQDQNGNLQWNTPLTKLIQAAADLPEPIAPGKPHPPEVQQQQNFNRLAKSHPWVPVESGFVPVPGFFEFVNAIEKTQKQGFPQQLKVGDETLPQIRAQLAQATNASIESRAAEGPMLGLNKGGVLTPAQSDKLLSQTGAKKAVVTVKAGQEWLQKAAPEFFNDLPANGYMNADWGKRLRQWQSTGDYFRQSTQRLAEENGFGNRVDVFVKAWSSKQQAIKKNPFAAQFIRNIPLNWFALNAVKPGMFGNKLSGLRFAVEGPDRAGWHLITPSGLLGGLVNTVKLGVDVAAGSFQQTEADSAFATTYMRGVAQSSYKKGQTEEKAREAARTQLLADPSALRAAMVGSLPEHPTGKLALANQLAEIAFDIAISHPKVTGFRVKPGNAGLVARNTYFQAKIPWAYQSLKSGDLGQAVKTLGRTKGAEQLAVKLMPVIKSGQLSQREFESMASSMYAHGRVPLPDGTFVHGDVLPELKSYSMPKAGPAGQIAQEAWGHITKAMDDFESGLRSNGFKGTGNAANFLGFARVLFTRAAPKGVGLTERQRYLFADRTPDDIYNFTVRNFRKVEGVDARALASKWRDEFITARANDNIQGMLAVQEKLHKLYHEHFPADVHGQPAAETGGPQLLAEAPTYFNFPTRQYREITADSSMWDRIDRRATQINDKLNQWGGFHRRLIVSGVPFGGESLLYKHATSDTLRRMVGGGGKLFGETREVKKARSFLDDYYKNNPSAMRFARAEGNAAKMGEYRYMAANGSASPVPKFTTGEKFGTPAESQYLKAAGQDMRHLLSDDALLAFQQASKDDLSPLVKLARTNRFHVAQWKNSEAYRSELEQLGPKADSSAIAALNREHATDYAQALYDRYQGLNEGLYSAGTNLDEAAAVLRRAKTGKEDSSLAKFIKDNKVDYEVRSGLVANRFDDLMQRWIGVLMTANKWNRGKMFDHVFHTTFAEMKKAGWHTDDAIQASAQIAKRQTVYHMLDFSNMLQVEQDFRWLSYFATKHRLYWSWIGKTAFRKPGLANLVKNEIGNHLDNGNLYFKVGGHSFFVPMGRLIWVNSREYPETSPIVQALFAGGSAAVHGKTDLAGAVQQGLAAVSGTSGNVFTRSDQAILQWAKFANVETGRTPATYDAVIHGMGAKQQQEFNRRYNLFLIGYFNDHGVYPSESVAVKHALLASAITETQRSNMFVPIMPDDRKPKRIRDLFKQFGAITDPRKKSNFLQAHPDLENWFGLTKNSELRQHENDLWARYSSAQDAFDKGQNALLDKVISQGYFTPEDANTLKHLGAVRNAVINHLKEQDKAWSGPGKKAGEPGPWTQQLEGDPLATRGFVHKLFPNIPAKNLAQGTIGSTYEDLVKTRELLVKHKYSYPAQVYKDALTAINQKISVFYGASKTPLPAAEHQYYSEHVTPYIQQREAKLNEVNSQKSAQSGGLVLNPKTGQYEYKPSLDLLETEFRAWRDAHDHPVTIKIKGHEVKFPSPVKMGWLRLPPDLRKAALAQLAADSYEHLANYEKELLGLKPVKGESQAWVDYTKVLDLYQREAALSGQSISKEQRAYIAKLVVKGVPGYSEPHPDFLKAYRFAQKPKYQRVEQTSLIKDSQYKDQWKQILSTANYFWKGIQGGSPQRQTQAIYREYVNGSQFQSWLNQQPSGFRKELSLFGPDFLNTLTSH